MKKIDLSFLKRMQSILAYNLYAFVKMSLLLKRVRMLPTDVLLIVKDYVMDDEQRLALCVKRFSKIDRYLESFDFQHIVSIYTNTFYNQIKKEFYDLFPTLSYKRGERWIHSTHPFLNEIKCSKPETFVNARNDNKNRCISSSLRLFELMKETDVVVREANIKMRSIAYGFLKTVCITHDTIENKKLDEAKRLAINQKKAEKEQALAIKQAEKEKKKAYNEYEMLQKKADKEEALNQKRVERETLLSQKREEALFVKRALKQEAILFAKLQQKNKAMLVAAKKKEAADKRSREAYALSLLSKFFQKKKIV